MNYYISVLKNYATFTGRARRKEYWMFFLFNVIICIVAMVLDNLLGLTFKTSGINMGYGYIYMLYTLAVFIPGLAVWVRRLHDVGKSGWFVFIVLIPLIGAIWILVLLCTDSKPGVNKYGPNPKGIGNNQFDSIDS